MSSQDGLDSSMFGEANPFNARQRKNERAVKEAVAKLA
jgi:hypothetical protein